MSYLDQHILASFNSALSKMTGATRRSYAAELAETYFGGSSRKTERCLNVSREMVQLGLKERETGITCVDAFPLRGRKRKEEL